MRFLMTFFPFLLALIAIVTSFVLENRKDSLIAPIKTLAQVVSPTPVFIQPGTSSLLPSAKWVPQSFNNCGPAATSMVLQYFGYNVSQEETKAHLRTNPDDKNVFIWEISDYLRKDYGIESRVMYGGNLSTLKTLIVNNTYVVVEDFLHPNEDIGHVLIIHGYDDKKGVLIADDSYFGTNIEYPYETWDKMQWRPYNREYMPVYTKDKENLVKAILGENWDTETMYKNALKQSQKETAENPTDMYAYFNEGSDYFGLKQYENAEKAYDTSKSLGWPKRMLWYQIQPVQVKNILSKYNEALTLADAGMWANDTFAELHVQKAKAYAGLGQKELSDKELEIAQNLDPKSHL